MKIIVTILWCYLSIARGLENGVARTPPMGWMSWQRFRCITDCDLYPDDCISDRLFRRIADLMITEGYKAAGYEYVIIDDCWLAKTRDEHGRLQPDPDRFPYGMKNLSDYIHSKGLKFGMYEDYGNFTCKQYPGILGHLETDAQTLINWEIDYLKVDGCNANKEDYVQGYTDFGQHLKKSNRPIVYSCSWPYYLERNGIQADYAYASKVCNLWRNWRSVVDSYESVATIIKWYSKNQDRLQPHAGPGHWNDPDMLLIGNYGLSYEQSKTQMALWAILAAPLLMSVDLSTIEPKYKKILLNKELIKINQDQLGIQGRLVDTITNITVWTRPITPVVDGYYSYAVAFYSTRDDGYPFVINYTLKQLGLNCSAGYLEKDVFQEGDNGRTVRIDDKLSVRVKPSGTVAFKLTPLSSLNALFYMAPFM